MVTTKLRHAVVTLLLTTTLCLAWGCDGQRIVGEIASNYLSPCAEEAIESRGFTRYEYDRQSGKLENPG